MAKFDPKHPNNLEYEEAAPLIRDGWIAQFRGQRWFSHVIQYATGGPHSHSAMLRRNRFGSVDVMEMVEWHGGRIRPLGSYVQRWPGIIDVFSIDQKRYPEFNVQGAVSYMRLLTGRNYGWRGIGRLALQKIPLLWRLVPFSGDDAYDSKQAPFCSHAVCSACRIGGGEDPVPNLSDDRVSPNQLTWSKLFNYEFTLTP